MGMTILACSVLLLLLGLLLGPSQMIKVLHPSQVRLPHLWSDYLNLYVGDCDDMWGLVDEEEGATVAHPNVSPPLEDAAHDDNANGEHVLQLHTFSLLSWLSHL